MAELQSRKSILLDLIAIIHKTILLAKTDEVLKAKEKKDEEARRKKEEEDTSLPDQVKRIKAIEAIESDSFVAQAFKSSRDGKKVVETVETKQDPESVDLPRLESEHHEVSSIPTSIRYQENDSLAHPNLFIDKAEAEEMWLYRLMTLRQERLMGSPVP
ncbi:RSRC1 protein, partial [Atractosteus spatula]|nr:RSRC1 protein [Atractosteus spatula]